MCGDIERDQVKRHEGIRAERYVKKMLLCVVVLKKTTETSRSWQRSIGCQEKCYFVCCDIGRESLHEGERGEVDVKKDATLCIVVSEENR
ncbi:hypothetical protein AVEN_219672-1 [Araneus ventricosus]|uniref:Uncharacterized protein n=1 Tax=Araneus ventricosus TaxID=182803 RepID=A0A4Y2BTN6_ARAVE|nr:hypothetical protein AVEN_219672-1 [Araneus ventricosus]